MLERWVDDILSAMKQQELALREDRTLLVNSIVFELMGSPLWRGQFDGVGLCRSTARAGVGWVHYDEQTDPLCEYGDLAIREAGLINGLSWMYEGWMDEDDVDVWVSPYDDDVVACEPLDNEESAAIKRVLAKEPYYRMLLCRLPGEVSGLLAAMTELSYSWVNGDGKQDPEAIICDKTKMGSASYGEVKQFWGHRYFGKQGRSYTYIIAENPLGVAGIMCLFHEESEAGVEVATISYVSVTPGYRGSGIAGKLLEKALEVAEQQGWVIGRTSPTEIGKKYLFDKYSRMGRDSVVPMMEPALSSVLHQISAHHAWKTLDKKERLSLLSKALSHFRAKYSGSALSDRWGLSFDASDLDYLNKLVAEVP